MSVLRSLETKIADLVEGAFGRAFRSEIRPVELARRLAREMDRHRTDSLASTHVPYEYVVWLSPADRRHLAPIEQSLIEELGAHLLEHARAQRLALDARPSIELRTDRRLSLGQCGIEARVGPPRPAAAEQPLRAPARAVPVAAPLPGATAPLPGRVDGHPAAAERRAFVEVGGTRVEVGAAGITIGRSNDLDIVLAASEVSRHHARVAPVGDGWTLTDLESTNGVLLNGRQLDGQAPLEDGDVIEIGGVELIFEVR